MRIKTMPVAISAIAVVALVLGVAAQQKATPAKSAATPTAVTVYKTPT